MSILARHRIGDGFVQRLYAVPFVRRPDMAVAADLIDTPVDFQGVVVRVAELDGDLTAGAAPSFKVDLGAVLLQPVAGAQHFAEGRDFEGEVMQFAMAFLPSPWPTRARQ